MSMRKIGLCLLLCGVSSGCASRQHMSENHGVQTRRFFAKQRVNATATQGSPSGLDSEEAALIQATYKDTLGHDRHPPDAQSRVLLLKESDGDPAGP